MDPHDALPPTLEAPARAALAWLNEGRGTRYRLTGLVDTEAALAAAPGEPLEFGLVLCEGDHCTREQVRVEPGDAGYTVSAGATAETARVPPLLDPPAGVRSAWLDEQLARYDFILLLFYRGRW